MVRGVGFVAWGSWRGVRGVGFVAWGSWRGCASLVVIHKSNVSGLKARRVSEALRACQIDLCTVARSLRDRGLPTESPRDTATVASTASTCAR